MKLISFFNIKRQIILAFLVLSSFAFSQTIPSSNAAANCTSCAPTGWTIVTGTPDISSQTIAASTGGVSGGAGALWTNATGGGGTAVTLPAAPNGNIRWISLRDVGPGNTQESISAPIGSLVVGREYEVVVYSLTATTNQAGTSNVAYAGSYIDFFTFQVGAGPLQTVSMLPSVTPVRTWGTRRLRFIASATSETIVLRPGTNSTGTSANTAADFLLFEAVNLVVTVNAVNAVPIAGNDTGTTLQNAPVSVNVTTNDSDPDGAIVVSTVDLDPSTTGIQNTLTTAQGTWTVNNLGVVTFTPISSFVGTATIPYTIQDNYTLDGNSVPATSAPANISITVIGDNDGDGIADNVDLDDDNDGILDTVECPPTNAVTNGTFNTDLSGWTSSGGWAFTGGTATNQTDNAANQTLSQTLSNLDKAQNGVVTLTVTIGAQDGSNAAGSTATLDILLNNTVYATLSNSTVRTVGTNNITIALSNGATSTFTPFSTASQTGYTTQTFTVTIPYTGPASSALVFRMNAVSDDWSVDNVAIPLSICDTDNDGIPNYLDVDSDNDGCADAVEGSENVRFTQIHAFSLLSSDANYPYRGQIKVLANGTTTGTPSQVISTVAAANGVPLLVNNATNNTGGVAGVADNTDGTADAGQGIGTAQNSNQRDADCARCFRPATSPGTGGLSTSNGITALSRGGNNGNWPMKITGAYTVLDAKTKGFVINRMPTTQLVLITAPVVGMMVYDTTVNCLKIYDDSNTWRCFSNPTCDNFNQ